MACPGDTDRIEVGVTKAVADMAAAEGVPHVSVVSAQGANHKQFAVEWFHPLLYGRTLGQKEQAVLQHPGIPRVSIFRPGMIIGLEK